MGTRGVSRHRWTQPQAVVEAVEKTKLAYLHTDTYEYIVKWGKPLSVVWSGALPGRDPSAPLNLARPDFSSGMSLKGPTESVVMW